MGWVCGSGATFYLNVRQFTTLALEQLGIKYQQEAEKLGPEFDEQALVLILAIVPHSIEDLKPVADCATGSIS
jgi:hypothetical protein